MTLLKLSTSNSGDLIGPVLILLDELAVGGSSFFDAEDRGIPYALVLSDVSLGEAVGDPSKSNVVGLQQRLTLEERVIVILRRRFARWPGFVLVGVNRRGQLPAVLEDPVDCTGRVIHGLWLGDSVDDGCDGTTYCKVKRVARRR